ncbi:MAG: S-adenosylmethionine-binding domain-containing protein [Planctomycetaceae bacterium]|nr:S-adenosylmethionine-binding domain-containing protein [Planctomycetaceae bacterium]
MTIHLEESRLESERPYSERFVCSEVGQGRPPKNSAESAPLKTTETIANEIGMSKRSLQVNKPHGRKIELFARKPAEGWDTWGNQS